MVLPKVVRIYVGMYSAVYFEYDRRHDDYLFICQNFCYPYPLVTLANLDMITMRVIPTTARRKLSWMRIPTKGSNVGAEMILKRCWDGGQSGLYMDIKVM